MYKILNFGFSWINLDLSNQLSKIVCIMICNKTRFSCPTFGTFEKNFFVYYSRNISFGTLTILQLIQKYPIYLPSICTSLNLIGVSFGLFLDMTFT